MRPSELRQLQQLKAVTAEFLREKERERNHRHGTESANKHESYIIEIERLFDELIQSGSQGDDCVESCKALLTYLMQARIILYTETPLKAIFGSKFGDALRAAHHYLLRNFNTAEYSAYYIPENQMQFEFKSGLRHEQYYTAYFHSKTDYPPEEIFRANDEIEKNTLCSAAEASRTESAALGNEFLFKKTRTSTIIYYQKGISGRSKKTCPILMNYPTKLYSSNGMVESWLHELYLAHVRKVNAEILPGIQIKAAPFWQLPRCHSIQNQSTISSRSA